MSILRFLSRHVTAADLQTPFGLRFSIDDTTADVWDSVMEAEGSGSATRLTNSFESICLVGGSDGRPTHFIWPEDLKEASDQPLSEVATPILIEHCVAANTPAMQLVKLFAAGDRYWALVLTGAELTGYVTWADLSRPEFSVSVFALLLEVEQRCVDALADGPLVAAEAWKRLSPGRQAKAMTVFAQRFDRPPDDATLTEKIICTTFADKATMLPVVPAFREAPKRKLRDDFAAMENLRNTLAHTGIDVRIEPKQLLATIEAAEGTLKRLEPQTTPELRLVASTTRPERSLPLAGPLSQSIAFTRAGT